jgi:hypothetical protein
VYEIQHDQVIQFYEICGSEGDGCEEYGITSLKIMHLNPELCTHHRLLANYLVKIFQVIWKKKSEVVY